MPNRSLIKTAFVVLLLGAHVAHAQKVSQSRSVVWTAGSSATTELPQPDAPTRKDPPRRAELVSARQAGTTVNTTTTVGFTPNDPRYDSAKASLSGLPDAWAETNRLEQLGQRNPDAVVIVADAWVNCKHLDLEGKCLTQYTRDFTGESQYEQPNNSHGSNVASIIATGTNNGIGPTSVAGLNSHVKLIIGKIINSAGQTFPILFRQLMQWALDLKAQGVNIVAINCSFGGAGDDNPAESLRLIHLLEQQGIIIVAASGESTSPQNLDTASSPSCPACYANPRYSAPNVIAVTGETADGQHVLSNDNWGPDTIAVAAPATNIPVISDLDPINGAASFADSSAAAPHVSGAVGLLSVYKETDLTSRLQRIKLGAVPYPELSGKVGYGALNVYNSLTLTLPAATLTLLTEPGTSNAVAFESPTMLAAPFSLTANHNLAASDRATRVMLFAINANLAAGEGASAVTAQTSTGISLPVEFAGAVPNATWLTEVVVKLPTGLSTPGSVSVSIAVHGVTSNQALIRLK